MSENNGNQPLVAPEDRVPFLKKLAYALGGPVDIFSVWVLVSIAYPLLNMELHLRPLYVSIILMSLRLWDGLIDPVMGWISDNTRTRWGRRRPYILLGAVLAGLAYPLLWWFPMDYKTSLVHAKEEVVKIKEEAAKQAKIPTLLETALAEAKREVEEIEKKIDALRTEKLKESGVLKEFAGLDADREELRLLQDKMRKMRLDAMAKAVPADLEKQFEEARAEYLDLKKQVDEFYDHAADSAEIPPELIQRRDKWRQRIDELEKEIQVLRDQAAAKVSGSKAEKAVAWASAPIPEELSHALKKARKKYAKALEEIEAYRIKVARRAQIPTELAARFEVARKTFRKLNARVRELKEKAARAAVPEEINTRARYLEKKVKKQEKALKKAKEKVPLPEALKEELRKAKFALQRFQAQEQALRDEAKSTVQIPAHLSLDVRRAELRLVYWIIGFGIIFYTCFTIWAMPYQSLLMEMTPDYHERTRVAEIRGYFQTLAGFVNGWIWWITLRPFFHLVDLNTGDMIPSTANGMRYVGLAIAALILVLGVIPAFFVKERYYESNLAKNQKKFGLFWGLKVTLTNGPFLLLCFFTLLFLLGTAIFDSYGRYVGTYYVLGGDWDVSSRFAGYGTVIYTVFSLSFIPFFRWLSERIGKLKCLAISTGLVLFSASLTWWTFTPKYPYLMLLNTVFIGAGYAGLWLMLPSMQVDVVDLDELKTGERREGSFASIYSWVLKISFCIGFLLSGPLLEWTGFDAALGAAQPESVYRNMRIGYIAVPVSALLVALLLLKFFPVTPEKAAEIRAELEKRRGKV